MTSQFEDFVLQLLDRFSFKHCCMVNLLVLVCTV